MCSLEQAQANRLAALLAGQSKYEGTACREGHTVRYTSCKSCVICQLARSEARYRESRFPTPALAQPIRQTRREEP